jgi:serine/threonine-protein kinase
LPAYETGDFEGRYYFVTGYIKGVTLQEFLKQRGKLEEKEVLNMVIPIADALKYAWDSQKIIHRNIKPETILIADGDKPILEDFGMAKSFSNNNSAELTMMNVTIGNPDYMSPEQVRGERDLDYRCDMYCLGLVLYEMLAGQHPFAHCKTQFQLMEAHIKETPKRVNEINMVVKEGCTSIIEKLLQKDKEQRYQDWDSLIRDMKNVLAGNRASCQQKADKEEIEKYKQQAKDKAHQSTPKAAPQFVEVTKTDTKTVTILTVIIIVQFLLILGLLIAFIVK